MSIRNRRLFYFPNSLFCSPPPPASQPRIDLQTQSNPPLWDSSNRPPERTGGGRLNEDLCMHAKCKMQCTKPLIWEEASVILRKKKKPDSPLSSLSSSSSHFPFDRGEQNKKSTQVWWDAVGRDATRRDGIPGIPCELRCGRSFWFWFLAPPVFPPPPPHRGCGSEAAQ